MASVSNIVSSFIAGFFEGQLALSHPPGPWETFSDALEPILSTSDPLSSGDPASEADEAKGAETGGIPAASVAILPFPLWVPASPVPVINNTGSGSSAEPDSKREGAWGHPSERPSVGEVLRPADAAPEGAYIEDRVVFSALSKAPNDCDPTSPDISSKPDRAQAETPTTDGPVNPEPEHRFETPESLTGTDLAESVAGGDATDPDRTVPALLETTVEPQTIRRAVDLPIPTSNQHGEKEECARPEPPCGQETRAFLPTTPLAIQPEPLQAAAARANPSAEPHAASARMLSTEPLPGPPNHSAAPDTAQAESRTIPLAAVYGQLTSAEPDQPVAIDLRLRVRNEFGCAEKTSASAEVRALPGAAEAGRAPLGEISSTRAHGEGSLPEATSEIRAASSYVLPQRLSAATSSSDTIRTTADLADMADSGAGRSVSEAVARTNVPKSTGSYVASWQSGRRQAPANAGSYLAALASLPAPLLAITPRLDRERNTMTPEATPVGDDGGQSSLVRTEAGSVAAPERRVPDAPRVAGVDAGDEQRQANAQRNGNEVPGMPRVAGRKEPAPEEAGPKVRKVESQAPLRTEAHDFSGRETPAASLGTATFKPGSRTSGPLKTPGEPPTAAAGPGERNNATLPKTSEITLRIAGDRGDAAGVDVRVSDKGGQVSVTVRAADPQLTSALREGLPELVSGLERRGYEYLGAATDAYRAETRDPVAQSVNGDAAFSSGENSQQQKGQHQQQNQQQQNGSHSRDSKHQWIDELRRLAGVVESEEGKR